MMKGLILGTTALLVAAGSAMAAPKTHGDRGHNARGHVTAYERVQIAKSARHVALVKHRARADGHVTRREHMQIRRAEAHLKAVVKRAHRS